MTARTGATSILPVLLIGLLWGLNWPAVKFMLTEMPPITIRGTAFLFAATLLFIIAKWRGEKIIPDRKDWWPIVYTGVTVLFGFNVCSSLGQLITETSKAAIIAFTMPALTAGLAVIFLGDRLSRRVILALVAGMTGLAVLASENLSAFIADPTGPAIMFAAALSWAIGTVCLKARTWSLQTIPLTVWFFVVSAAAAWPLIFIFEPLHQQTWPSTAVWLTMAFHVIGPMVTCYVLWAGMVGRLPATIAAIATLMVPFVGVFSAVILLGDDLTWQKTVALALILVSILLTQIKPARYRE